MAESGVQQLTAAIRGTLVAVAREEVVQIWDSATSEKISELKAPYEWGGFRLALNPTGGLCAAASFHAGFYKGRRGGVTCYDVPSAKTLWHRDIRHTQCVRFASDSKSVYCGRDEGPLLRLCCATGETLDELGDTADVQQSPYSAHALVVPRSNAYILQAARRHSFERRTIPSGRQDKPQRTCSPTAIGFGPDSVWLAEQGLKSLLRCFNYNGIERWQVEIPESTIICQLCYRPADGNFYGVEQDQSGTWCHLVRYSDTGAGEKVSNVRAWWGHQGFCLDGDTVVTPEGDVIETTRGTIINNIRFR